MMMLNVNAKQHARVDLGKFNLLAAHNYISECVVAVLISCSKHNSDTQIDRRSSVLISILVRFINVCI